MLMGFGRTILQVIWSFVKTEAITDYCMFDKPLSKLVGSQLGESVNFVNDTLRSLFCKWE